MLLGSYFKTHLFNLINIIFVKLVDKIVVLYFLKNLKLLTIIKLQSLSFHKVLY